MHMNSTTAHTPLAVLAPDLRAEVNTLIDMALNGECSWSFAIRHTQAIVDVTLTLTPIEAQGIMEYVRTF
jgi:hypothetical protein